MLQQVLQPMEHTYGDYMSEQNEVSFIIISEEIATTGADRAIILNPFTRLYKNSPLDYKCAVTIGFMVDNTYLESLIFQIKAPDGKLIFENDIKGDHVDYGGYTDRDGNRLEVDIVGEIGISIDSIPLKTNGKYSMHVFFNDNEIGKSFFIVGEAEVTVSDQ